MRRTALFASTLVAAVVAAGLAVGAAQADQDTRDQSTTLTSQAAPRMTFLESSVS